MALYLLNISIDSPDKNPEHIAEDLSFNDQESMVELVLEKILGYENAIKEYDDPDRNDEHKKKNVKVDLLANQTAQKQPYNIQDLKQQAFGLTKVDGLAAGFIEIDSPPPKS